MFVRTLCVMFLALALVRATMAQEPETSGRYKGPGVLGAWASQTPKANIGPKTNGAMPSLTGAFALKTPKVNGPKLLPTGTLQPATSPCSVPLLEAQIPQDAAFTVVQIHPRTDRLAPMPQGRVPAPSCASSSPR